jgi:hypothetical protein
MISTAIVTDRGDVARLLALSDERDRWLSARLAHAKYSYRRGYRDGWGDGHEAAATELAAAWHEVAGPASRGGESCAEYERRRWGPGGRAHFGDPRAGDFPGRQARAA